ncbi:MAG: hypothetical protein HY719_02805 [Planctomycetes bacterium]|nr:hypothetical protein [Planctomycetota bacterium]
MPDDTTATAAPAAPNPAHRREPDAAPDAGVDSDPAPGRGDADHLRALREENKRRRLAERAAREEIERLRERERLLLDRVKFAAFAPKARAAGIDQPEAAWPLVAVGDLSVDPADAKVAGVDEAVARLSREQPRLFAPRSAPFGGEKAAATPEMGFLTRARAEAARTGRTRDIADYLHTRRHQEGAN